MNTTRWNRREVLGGVLAAGALGSAPLRPSLAQQPVDTMAERGEFLIRNAYVLTMDAGVGDIAGGDVHVRAGAIAAVGRGLTAPGAEIIDGAGMLVLPGFVETHWHVWTTLLRSLAGDRQEHGYFPTSQNRWHVLLGRRHVRRGAARRGRGRALGHHVRARLVPQRARPRLRRSRIARTYRKRHSRALLVRLADGREQRREHRFGRSHAAARRLGRPFERRLVDARPRLARRRLGRDGARLRSREGARAADFRSRQQLSVECGRHRAARHAWLSRVRTCR